MEEMRGQIGEMSRKKNPQIDLSKRLPQSPKKSINLATIPEESENIEQSENPTPTVDSVKIQID